MEGEGGVSNLPNYPFPLDNISIAPPLEARFLIDESTEDSNKLKLGVGGFLPSSGGDDEISNDIINRKSLKRGRSGSSSATLVKRKWVAEEDRALVKLVKNYGEKKWAAIAQQIDGRTAKQCRDRWQNHLRPHIKKDSWTEEEEKIFVESHKKLGNRWSEIARKIPGRTENAVKNHWNAAKRRNPHKRSKKKQVANHPNPPSLLQDYILKSISDAQSMNNPKKEIMMIGAIDCFSLPLMEPLDDPNNSSQLINGDAQVLYDQDLLFVLDTQHLQHFPPPLLQNPDLMAKLPNWYNDNLYNYHSQLFSSNMLGEATGQGYNFPLSSLLTLSPKVESYRDCYFDDNEDLGSAMANIDGGGGQLRKDMDLIEMVSIFMDKQPY